ncbi:MerR family transcriptional regulator [Usitatibacter palustris]|uniref:HTH-type transcriptional repressor CarA n=1 Tax=Usitatibacter palustris TaxID=2732487 RepID=A0A6M4H2R3_9PROT|nr:MerR family transcriptional regulator [Usitatibacter palustris]QJR13740.1 HTH-type transcriptional repressor CarA [Usitatibacter palustris]
MATPDRMATAAEHLPIRVISSLTGVNPITLRAWERRYGLIQPLRTPKGHRLYTRHDVDEIQRVLALMEQGVPIGRVREALAATRPVRGAPKGTGAWRVHLERMATAIGHFDEAGLDAVYDEALALHSIDQVSRNLLMPLLEHLGSRWEQMPGAVAEEHFFSGYMRNKLGARLHHRRHLATGPRILAACVPGEHHELGLLLFTLAAHEAGLRVISLGANMPLAEIAMAARRARCKAIVLASSIDPSPEVLNPGLRDLVDGAGIPVFYGGKTAERQAAVISAAGATPLGTAIDAGVRAIVARLGRT